MIAPAGEADTWPPDLIHQLARLAKNTRDKYAIAMHALLQVWRLPLARYPESDPDVIARDVETVCTRMVFLKKYGILRRKGDYLEVAAPRLDVFPSPPSWRKRRRVSLVDRYGGEEEIEDRQVYKNQRSSKGI
jgi:hypothetical protein